MVLSVSVNHTSKHASAAIRRAQRQRVEDSGDMGFSVALEAAPSDRGGLTASAFEPEWVGDVLQWGFTATHAKPQEFGTVGYYPPLEPLLDWAERIGKDRGFGWWVARKKIPEEGIEAKHFARDGRDAQARFLQSRPLSSYLDRELR